MIFRNIALSTLAIVSVVNAETWRSDLDWDSLAAKLSPTASLIDTRFSDYVEQCRPGFDKLDYERTAHDLINQSSGMCVTQYFCAYERCWPRPDAASSTFDQELSDYSAWTPNVTFEALNEETQGWISDPHNPSLNLPSKVLFPVVASDVVEAIKFAGEHGLEISVKNSGHSFIGASTKKDTLHINMNRFTAYSSTSIVDCDETILEDMDDQPCSLAFARNKPAFIRSGGGENWDKVYRSVEAANRLQGNKYHTVGGGAGTVSPMGWTFQGGLAGTTGGRKYGFGVDQVLQVEMVLPNGEHVRFGPVQWEDTSADGFVVPKTTSVGGVCRSNPQELDESLWEWSECPEDLGINFDDLWFAVNGGGGGTWGVVTSIYLQLQEYTTSRLYGLVPEVFLTEPENCDFATMEALEVFFETFRLMYIMVPSKLNVTQADSDACGMADTGFNAMMCFGDGPYQTMVNEWEKFVTNFFDPAAYGGISAEIARNCPVTKEVTWAENMKFPEGHPYAGKVSDAPYPTIGQTASTTMLNVLFPQKWVEETFDAYIEIWAGWNLGPEMYLAFGSGTASNSDQANSLGEAHRTAGYKAIVDANDFYSTLFAEMYDISDKSNFPGFQGSNHIAATQMGPLKEDWTQACPIEWTQAERDEKCVSIQETIYGTKVLKRLEAIKEAIDPNYMFDCAGCIGNNRMKEATIDETDEASVGSIASVKYTVVVLLSFGAFFL